MFAEGNNIGARATCWRLYCTAGRRAMDTRGIECRKFLQENLVSMEEVAAMLYKNSSGAFTKSHFDKQKTGALSMDWTDSLMFDLLGKTSQCDYCGNVAVGTEGKMLSCGGCRMSHYCDRSCQRSDWKNGHRTQCCKQKVLSKTHSRVLDTCIKMLSLMCIDWTGENSGILAEDNYVYNHIKRSGFNENVYVPVRDTTQLLFIPMPTKALKWIASKYHAKPNVTLAQSQERMHRALLSRLSIMLLYVPVWSAPSTGDPVISQVMKLTRINLPNSTL